MNKRKQYYIDLRNQWIPENIKIIFICESPPVSGKYFYDTEGLVTEPLFSAMMNSVLGINPVNKKDGLLAFQQAGLLIIDATYTPVNKLTDAKRDTIITKNYSNLKDDLRKVMKTENTPLVLVKANVCRLLETRLIGDNFNVMNKGMIIPFPACGRQNEFKEKIELFY